MNTIEERFEILSWRIEKLENILKGLEQKPVMPVQQMAIPLTPEMTLDQMRDFWKNKLENDIKHAWAGEYIESGEYHFIKNYCLEMERAVLTNEFALQNRTALSPEQMQRVFDVVVHGDFMVVRLIPESATDGDLLKLVDLNWDTVFFNRILDNDTMCWSLSEFQIGRVVPFMGRYEDFAAEVLSSNLTVTEFFILHRLGTEIMAAKSLPITIMYEADARRVAGIKRRANERIAYLRGAKLEQK